MHSSQTHAAIQSITAFAPATCANIAVGFDILGFAINSVGDSITLTRRTDEKVVITEIIGDKNLPLYPEKNVASGVILKLRQDLNITDGFSIRINKGIPLGSGMGGSAASTVAALVAFNAFLQQPLTPLALAAYALLGEEIATGHRHADNVVPCLLGGMTLTRSLDPIKVTQLPIPNIHCVIVHPHLRLDTHDARAVLKRDFSLQCFVRQSANLAGFIAALYENDLTLLQTSLEDVLIEPCRAPLVPAFYQAKEAALQNGALGASLSGSGPSLFAFAKDAMQAHTIAQAMSAAFQQAQIKADFWCSPINERAAQVIEIIERK